MSHIFISYVSENTKLAAWICSQLKANGMDPWFSQDEGRITPGDDWRKVLKGAVEKGGFYVPIFTKEWTKRSRSVANEELFFAAEEARMRPAGRRWIIPIKADSDDLPEIDLGGGRALENLQYIDVPRLGWLKALRSLLHALGVDEPKLDHGEPLAPGFGANATIVGGFITYRNFSIPIPEIDGTSFTVTGGYVVRREDGSLFANFSLRAPFEQLQLLNEEMGLDSIDVVSSDGTISIDPDNPSHFRYYDEKDPRPPGTPFWVLGAKEPLQAEVGFEQVTGYDAFGHLNSQDQLVGTFKGFVETASVLGKVRVTFEGDFNLQLMSIFAPTV